jgi:O-antigen/teichoic acid export membrane protein
MSLSKKIAKNTIAQIIGKAVSTLLGLFSLALITRSLGPNGFGAYTTIITFLGFFAVFADFGLTLITVQFISNKNYEEGKVLNNLFAFRLISVVIFMSLAPLVSLVFPYSQEIKLGMIIALASFIFPALNQIIIGLLQKRLHMGRDAMAENIGRAILLVGIIIADKKNLGLNGILFATTISAAINFLAHYLFSLKFAVIKLAWDFSLWKEIILKSWPLALTVVLNLIYLRADTIVLSIFKSSEDVGLYGAPYKMIDVLTTLPFMFAGLILPIITAAWLEGKKEYFSRVLQKSLDFMAIAAMPIVIGTQFIAKELMSIVTGSEFARSGIILRLLVISIAAIFIGTMFSHAVIAIDKQKKMIGAYVFTSITSLAAYLILVPKFSYFGAAAVTIYSEVMIAIFSALCVLKYSGFKTSLKTISKALMAGIIMGAFLYLNNINAWIDNTKILGLMLSLFISAIIYALALYLFGGIKKDDINMLFKKKSSGGQAYGTMYE